MIVEWLAPRLVRVVHCSCYHGHLSSSALCPTQIARPTCFLSYLILFTSWCMYTYIQINNESLPNYIFLNLKNVTLSILIVTIGQIYICSMYFLLKWDTSNRGNGDITIDYIINGDSYCNEKTRTVNNLLTSLFLACHNYFLWHFSIVCSD